MKKIETSKIMALVTAFVFSSFMWLKTAPHGQSGGIAMLIALSDAQRSIMAIAVSIGAGGGSLYVILSRKYDQATQKWAFGTLGTIIGYWLR